MWENIQISAMRKMILAPSRKTKFLLSLLMKLSHNKHDSHYRVAAPFSLPASERSSHKSIFANNGKTFGERLKLNACGKKFFEENCKLLFALLQERVAFSSSWCDEWKKCSELPDPATRLLSDACGVATQTFLSHCLALSIIARHANNVSVFHIKY